MADLKDGAAAYAPGASVEVEAPPKRPAQTERLLRSVCSWGSMAPLFFVGGSDGTLRSYIPTPGTDQLSFLRWNADFKKLFDTGSCFLDAWGVFATLADARLKLYELPLQSNPHLGGSKDTPNARSLVAREDTKGALLFAAHEQAHTLCVLLKSSTLKVFDWSVNRVLEPRATHELQSTLNPTLLPIQQLVMLSESHVFLQSKKDWAVLNLDSGKLVIMREDVLQQVNEALEGSGGVCEAVALPSRQSMRRRRQILDVLVCGKHHGVILTLAEEQKNANPGDDEDDALGAFNDGETSQLGHDYAEKQVDLSSDQLCVTVERILAYNAAPRGVYYHHPFLLLDQTEHMAVYNFGSLQQVQTLPVKALYGACVAVDVSSATLQTATGSGLQLSRPTDDRQASFFTVAPPFDVRMHQMLPIAQQLAAAMTSRRLEDAVALCQLCPEENPLSDDEQRKLYAAYGFELFRASRRQEAMAFFFESCIDVMDVLLLFPRNLLPRKASALRKDSSSNQKSEVLEGDKLVTSLLALIGFLRRKRSAFLRQEAEPEAMGLRTRRLFGGSDSSDENALELIDSMLVKCLVLVAEKEQYSRRANRALLSVVTGQNWCEIGEAEIFLRAHRRFQALLAFYSTRKLHRKALELLEDLERSAAAADKSDAPPETSDSLQSSHEYMVLIAQYLRVLGKKHAELVFEFSRRVLAVNPVLGLSIFTQREVPGRKEDIDPAAVLQHLKTCPLAASSSESKPTETDEAVEDTSEPTLPLSSNHLLAVEYLTQVIFDGARQLSPRLHDEVVYLLLDAIHAETPQSQRLTSRVNSQRGMTGLLRRKLLQFLEFAGAAYHPERMLSRTPTEMVDERAALLAKLGRHREVLQLYALELQDAALAEAYCNRCYENKTADSSIYSTLLRLYLRPSATIVGSPPKPSPLWTRPSSSHLPSEAVNAAINVLNKYAERIDVSTALELLPPDVAAAPLAGFFRRVLERQVERFRNGQVKKQLAKMENFKVRELLSAKRKGSVVVWSSQSCQSCGRKLGVGTFVRLPGGALLHYSCQPVP
ncbi:hypothetical protein BBJ28_00007361 [Nothophytophthora sp. Chile5]|nr:hypothetical protein BBJ28_00007361 [Nothophytophthora sp. Chile5]